MKMGEEEKKRKQTEGRVGMKVHIWAPSLALV